MASAAAQVVVATESGQIAADLENATASLKELFQQISAAGASPAQNLLDRRRELEELIKELTEQQARLTVPANRDQAATLVHLNDLEADYIQNYVFRVAEELLSNFIRDAMVLVPTARLQALRQLVPSLSGLQIEAKVLKESPKIKDLFKRWEAVYTVEKLQSRADDFNRQAVDDIKGYMNALLVGSVEEDEVGIIPALENAIASAIARFEQTKANPQLTANLAANYILVGEQIRQVASLGIANRDEAAHYVILLTAFAEKLQANVKDAEEKFAQVTQRIAPDARMADKLAVVNLAKQQIPTLNIMDADELKYYAFLLHNLQQKLESSRASATTRFAQIVDNLQAIENREERLRAVEAAMAGIAALQIADINESNHYKDSLSDLKDILQMAVDVAAQSINSKFAGLVGLQHLEAVRTDLQSFQDAAYLADMEENTRAHLHYLLKRRCNELETQLGLALTAFEDGRSRRGTLKARLAGAQAKLAAIRGSGLVLPQSSGVAAAAPTLIDVVKAAQEAAAASKLGVPAAAKPQGPQ